LLPRSKKKSLCMLTHTLIHLLPLRQRTRPP